MRCRLMMPVERVSVLLLYSHYMHDDIRVRPDVGPAQRSATPLYSQDSVTDSLMRDLLRKRRQKRKKMGICSPSWRPSPLKHWVPSPRCELPGDAGFCTLYYTGPQGLVP